MRARSGRYTGNWRSIDGAGTDRHWYIVEKNLGVPEEVVVRARLHGSPGRGAARAHCSSCCRPLLTRSGSCPNCARSARPRRLWNPCPVGHAAATLYFMSESRTGRGSSDPERDRSVTPPCRCGDDDLDEWTRLLARRPGFRMPPQPRPECMVTFHGVNEVCRAMSVSVVLGLVGAWVDAVGQVATEDVAPNTCRAISLRWRSSRADSVTIVFCLAVVGRRRLSV